MPSDTPGDASPRDPSNGGDRAGVAPAGDPLRRETTTAPAIAAPDWREAPRTAASGAGKATAKVRARAGRLLGGKDRRDRVRARRVLRVVRHIDPWSVLRVSTLFFAALFVIICIASAALWTVARSSGAVDDVESFVTSVGGFGNCENLDPSDPSATTTTAPGATTTTIAADPATSSTTLPVEPVEPVNPVDDEDCPAGQELIGEFRFEDGRILQAYILGGVVLVVAGAAGMVVLALLFNVFSDITGGVRVTVLEEDRRDAPAGSPPKRGRG